MVKDIFGQKIYVKKWSFEWVMCNVASLVAMVIPKKMWTFNLDTLELELAYN
jgi:hypothetical protein